MTGYFALAGVLSLFGIIHSPLRNERIDLPQRVLAQIPASCQEAIKYQTPYHWARAYALVVLMLLVLALFPAKAEDKARA